MRRGARTLSAGLIGAVAMALAATSSLPAGATAAPTRTTTPAAKASTLAIEEGYAFIDGLGPGGVDDKFLHQPGDIGSRFAMNVDGASSPRVWRGYDFTPDRDKLYGIVDDGFDHFLGLIDQKLAVIDRKVADLTPPDAYSTLTDLTIDPVSGAAYVAWTRGGPVSTRIYRLDLSSGATTLLSTVPGAVVLDMSMNCDGQLYAVEAQNDVLIRVDTASGAAATVGPLGVDVTGHQGIDFDNQTGLLNAWLYVGSNTTQYSSVDLGTGAATAFPNGLLTGEYEGAIKNGCPSEKCPKLEKQAKKAKKAVKAANKALAAAKDTGNQGKISKAKAKLKKAKKKLNKAEDAVEDGNCP